MFFDKKIKRNDLIIITNNFFEKYSTITNREEQKECLSNTLNQLENKLNSVEVKKDKRFSTIGRREFLREEFTRKVNKGNIIANEDYLLDSFYNIKDYIESDSWMSSSTVVSQGDISIDIIKKDQEYKKSGIIAHEEKEILLDMIKELKTAIINDSETQENEIFTEIYDIEIKKTICPYCNSINIKEYLYGEIPLNFDDNKYIYGGQEVNFSKKYHCKDCNNDFN